MSRGLHLANPSWSVSISNLRDCVFFVFLNVNILKYPRLKTNKLKMNHEWHREMQQEQWPKCLHAESAHWRLRINYSRYSIYHATLHHYSKTVPEMKRRKINTERDKTEAKPQKRETKTKINDQKTKAILCNFVSGLDCVTEF